MEKSYPAVNIGFTDINLTLSPGIKIEGLRVSLKEDPDTPVYVSEKSSIRISVPGWLKGESRYYFTSKVKGGEISGFLEEKNEISEGRVDAAIDMEGIRLDEDLFIHPLVSERVEGMLSGRITFTGNLSDPLKGNAEISIILADGEVKFKNPVLNLDAIEFKTMNLSGVIDKRRLNIKDLIITGGPVNCSAAGTVQISNDFQKSRLNIEAEIEPLPSLSDKMPEAEKAIDMIKSRMKNGKFRVDIQGTPERPIPKFR